MIYILKFYRFNFDDTAYKDIVLNGNVFDEIKDQACSALFSRFEQCKLAGKGSLAPHTAALIDENGYVVARFAVRPGNPKGGDHATEIPPKLWGGNMKGTNSPGIRDE